MINSTERVSSLRHRTSAYMSKLGMKMPPLCQMGGGSPAGGGSALCRDGQPPDSSATARSAGLHGLHRRVRSQSFAAIPRR